MKKLNRSLLCCGGILLVALGLTGCASGGSNNASAPKPTVQQTKARNEIAAYTKNSSQGVVQSQHLNTAHNTYDVKFNPKDINTMKYLNGQINKLNKMGNKMEHEEKVVKATHNHNKKANNELKREYNTSNKLLQNYLNTWSKKNLKQQQEDIAHTAEIGEVQEEVETSANQNKSKGLALDIANLPRNSAINKGLRKEARMTKQSINKRKDLSKQQKQQAIQSLNQSGQKAKSDAKDLGKPNANNKKLKNSQKEIQKASLQIAKSIRQLLNPKARRQMAKEFDQSLEQITKQYDKGQKFQQPGMTTTPNNNLNNNNVNNLNKNPNLNRKIRMNQNKFRQSRNRRKSNRRPVLRNNNRRRMRR